VNAEVAATYALRLRRPSKRRNKETNVREQQLGEAVGATPAPMQQSGDVPRAQNGLQYQSGRLIVASNLGSADDDELDDELDILRGPG
jgi:hypothetical protein